MKLPNGDQAIVPLPKLLDYLLSETHPTGRSKAKILRTTGFTEANVDLLQAGPLAIARAAAVVATVPSPYGVKYVAVGTLATPLSGDLQFRTVWIIETGLDHPRLVTAYPS